MPRYNGGFSRERARAAMAKLETTGAMFGVGDSLGLDPRAVDLATQATSAGDFDVALARVADARKYLDALEQSAVRGARRHGMTWAEVGHHLGITQQAASKRFKDLKTNPHASHTIQPATDTTPITALRGRQGRHALCTILDGLSGPLTM